MASAEIGDGGAKMRMSTAAAKNLRNKTTQ
jgi:hypothetical protein